MSLYVTGDTHANIGSLTNRISESGLGKDDTLIIVGDFGFFWSENPVEYNERVESLKKIQPTILFLDGNHENFDTLDSLKVIEKFDGYVGVVDELPNLYYLRRGQKYLIDNKRFIVMGGGFSVDKEYRLKREIPVIGFKLYWERELPNQQELDEFWNNYLSISDKGEVFDYVLTHEGPYNFIKRLYVEVFENKDRYLDCDDDRYLRLFFQDVYDKHYFKKWFCGHHHINCDTLADDFEMLFDKVVRIG